MKRHSIRFAIPLTEYFAGYFIKRCTWSTFTIKLDGHNRYAICTQNGLEYKTATVEIANRNEAINWIIDNQLGKRNLPQRVKTYLIGKRYTSEKKTISNPKGTNQFTEEVSGQNVHQPDERKTAEKIAEQNKVAEKTVRRNESFSDSIDTLAESSGEIAMDILTKTKLTQFEFI